MKHRLIRTAATAAVTLGLAGGITVLTAGGAQAVASNWLCDSLTNPSRGVVDGSGCVDSGVKGTGTGWIELYIGGGAYQIEYRCNTFSYVPEDQSDYYVTGTNCTPYAPS